MSGEGINEHGIPMCLCKRSGRVHAWEPGESCNPVRVVPNLTVPDSTPTERGAGDLKKLGIENACARLDPEGYGWATGDGPGIEEVVGALVATGWRPAPESTPITCPTCGPTRTEKHPRREGVTRCSNCKEWLTRPYSKPTVRDDVAAVLARVMIEHQRIPTFDGTGGHRCVGCDSLHGEPDGSNSPRHVEHVAAHLAAALAPLIAAREQAARAEALRELADDIDPSGYGWTSIRDAERFKSRLRERPGRIGGDQ